MHEVRRRGVPREKDGGGVKKAILCLVLACASACTDEAGSAKALFALGINNVTYTGYQLFGCGQDDTFHTGFSGINAQGALVTGVVCCGWLKNCTVRF